MRVSSRSRKTAADPGGGGGLGLGVVDCMWRGYGGSVWLSVARGLCTVSALRSDGAVARRVRHRSSVVEHTLGKGEVMGSSPIGGSGKGAEGGFCGVDASRGVSAHNVGPRTSRWAAIVLVRPSGTRCA